MSLYIDLTEFLTNPMTTGIQRIAGQICKYLPPKRAIPVRLHEGRYVALSPKLIHAIGKFFRTASKSEVKAIRRLGEATSPSIEVSDRDIVLVPEVIIELGRLAFFRSMPEHQLRRHRFIVYDLLPVTNPEYFWPGWLLEISAYYKILRRATCCGFISEDTRDAFYGRLKRTSLRGGVVLALGSDALGPRPNRPILNRPLEFSVLGTIEPRKNHQLILETFEPLLREIRGLSLSFIGKMGWVDSGFEEKVRSLAADNASRFRFFSASGDDEIRKCIEQSRATIYVSTAEGYGLPPVESLWASTPVIASTTIPSLKALGPGGIHFVEPLNAESLRDAVLAFLDDSYANQMIEETFALELPTWRSFTQQVLSWCSQEAGSI